jgi:Integrase zinc binding domain
VVYLLKKVKKEFVKEIHEELLVKHFRINKTREAVIVCYYFSLISRVVERVVKEYNMCNKSRTVTHKLYRLLMLPKTPKEL